MRQTPLAEDGIAAAVEFASALGEPPVAIHVVYGLGQAPDSYVARLLAENGVTAEAIRLFAVDRPPDSKATPLSEIVQGAERLAAEAGHAILGSEHLFFSATSDPQVQVFLASHSLDVRAARTQLFGGTEAGDANTQP